MIDDNNEYVDTNDYTYATVECCQIWPVVYAVNGELVGWRRCGICGEKPTLIDIEYKGTHQ